MHAAVVSEIGRGPAFGDFREPDPAPGETLVRVAAASLSQLARARASGRHYSSGGALPFVAGVDGVGVDPDGRRVYFLLPRAPFGAMAERTVVVAEQVVELPDGIDDVTAAAIANPGMSSWAALVERARLVRGETVLINGATGVSGRLAVGIARHLGAARVVATGRNREVLAGLGADATVALGDDDVTLDAALQERFADGIDVVLDYLWGESAARILAAAAHAGPAGRPIRFVQIGNVAGPEISLPAHVLRSSGLALMGSGLGSVPTARLLASISGVFGAAARGMISIEATAVPLAQCAAAWSDTGDRIVFTVDGGGGK